MSRKLDMDNCFISRTSAAAAGKKTAPTEIHKCINTFMNHRSHAIVIPYSSKQRCTFFQWSWAVKAPLFILMPLCFKAHCGTSASSRKTSWKGRAMGLSRKTMTLHLFTISTKWCAYMCSGMFMLVCACRYKGCLMVNHFHTTRLWSIGICSGGDMKHPAVDDTHIKPAACTVHPHGSEGIGIIVWRSIFMADRDLWASVVGGDALRLHFLLVCGRGTGQGMDWGGEEKKSSEW